MPRHLASKVRMIGFIISLCILTILPSARLLASSTSTGSVGTPTLEWSIDADIVVPDSDVVEQGAVAAQAAHIDALVKKLDSRGAKTETTVVGVGDKGTIYNLKSSGQGDIEAFRNLIFNTAKPQFRLLGGVTELEISGPRSDGKDMILILESNPSTGYRWQVAADSAMIAQTPSSYEMHTIGRGVPKRQIIRLTQGPTGSGVLKLVYKRSWEDTAITQRVKLKMSSIPAKLNLSNPNAPVGIASAPKGTVRNELFPSLPKSALPSRLDWRESGIVTPVRNQGSCGSCWAFGTVGTMESALGKSGTTGTDLSEQYLISCNQDAWGCSGGLTAHKYHYDTPGKNQTTIGAVLETTKPYTFSNGSCPTNYDKPYMLSGWEFITPTEFDVPTDDQIKSAIYTYGPITAGVCVGDAEAAWYAYTTGVFSTDAGGCGGSTDHQIILVGWDDTAPGHWILRNSWGATWGIDGYMYIKYGVSRVGEGTSWVTTGTASSEKSTLTVSPAGTGKGTVTSSPEGINCGSTCSAPFTTGTVVTLTATADSNSTFTGWNGGGCSGTGTCKVTLSTDVTVTPTFAGCSYTITSTNPYTFGYRTGSTLVRFTASSTSCPKPTIVAGADWLSYSNVVLTKSKGSVLIKATSPNPSSVLRSSTVAIGDATLTVNQKGAPCSFGAFNPSRSPTFGSSAHTGTFNVSITPSDCAWAVAVDPTCTTCGWLSVATPVTTTVTYNISANTGRRTRTGRIITYLPSKPTTKRSFAVTQTNRSEVSK